MKNKITGAIFIALAAAVIGGGIASLVGHNHHHHAPPVEFEQFIFYQPRIVAAPPAAAVTAGYMDITNNGGDARLLSVSAPFAGKTEIHETTEENGVAKMRPLPDGLPLPAGEKIELTPGGKHFMFLQTANPPAAGTETNLVLHFSNGQNATVQFPVLNPGEEYEHPH